MEHEQSFSSISDNRNVSLRCFIERLSDGRNHKSAIGEDGATTAVDSAVDTAVAVIAKVKNEERRPPTRMDAERRDRSSLQNSTKQPSRRSVSTERKPQQSQVEKPPVATSTDDNQEEFKPATRVDVSRRHRQERRDVSKMKQRSLSVGRWPQQLSSDIQQEEGQPTTNWDRYKVERKDSTSKMEEEVKSSSKVDSERRQKVDRNDSLKKSQKRTGNADAEPLTSLENTTAHEDGRRSATVETERRSRGDRKESSRKLKRSSVSDKSTPQHTLDTLDDVEKEAEVQTEDHQEERRHRGGRRDSSKQSKQRSASVVRKPQKSPDHDNVKEDRMSSANIEPERCHRAETKDSSRKSIHRPASAEAHPQQSSAVTKHEEEKKSSKIEPERRDRGIRKDSSKTVVHPPVSAETERPELSCATTKNEEKQRSKSVEPEPRRRRERKKSSSNFKDLSMCEATNPQQSIANAQKEGMAQTESHPARRPNADRKEPSKQTKQRSLSTESKPQQSLNDAELKGKLTTADNPERRPRQERPNTKNHSKNHPASSGTEPSQALPPGESDKKHRPIKNKPAIARESMASDFADFGLPGLPQPYAKTQRSNSDLDLKGQHLFPSMSGHSADAVLLDKAHRKLAENILNAPMMLNKAERKSSDKTDAGMMASIGDVRVPPGTKSKVEARATQLLSLQKAESEVDEGSENEETPGNETLENHISQSLKKSMGLCMHPAMIPNPRVRRATSAGDAAVINKGSQRTSRQRMLAKNIHLYGMESHSSLSTHGTLTTCCSTDMSSNMSANASSNASSNASTIVSLNNSQTSLYLSQTSLNNSQTE